MKKLLLILCTILPLMVYSRQRTQKMYTLRLDEDVAVRFPFKPIQGDSIINAVTISEYYLNIGTHSFYVLKVPFQDIELPYNNITLENCYALIASMRNRVYADKGYHIIEDQFYEIGRYKGYGIKIADNAKLFSEERIFIIGKYYYIISYSNPVNYDSGIGDVFFDTIVINQNGSSQLEGVPPEYYINYILVAIGTIAVIIVFVFLRRNKIRK